MKDIALPGARAALVGPDGLPQRPFYQWCLAVDRTVTDNTAGNNDADQAIKAIALKLGSPDGSVANIPEQGAPGTINGSGSIQVDGTLESGVVNLSLMYDTLFPGATTYYGADSAGKRGWFPVSAALADSSTIDVITDSTTGISSFNLIGFGALTTDSLTEGTVNLYFTPARVNAALAAGDGISLVYAANKTTISLVGLPIYVVSQDGDQVTDQDGDPLISSQSTSLPVDWSDVQSKPTTVAGYGITDAQVVGTPVKNGEFSLSLLPDPAVYKGCTIMVIDMTEGYRPAWSDGSNWRRFSDNTIAS